MGLGIVEDPTGWWQTAVCRPPSRFPRHGSQLGRHRSKSPFLPLFIPRVWSVGFRGISEEAGVECSQGADTFRGGAAREERQVVPRSDFSSIPLSLLPVAVSKRKSSLINWLFLRLIFIDLLILIWKNHHQQNKKAFRKWL